MLTFPTRGGGNRGGGQVGTPLEADHCECGDRRIVADDTCLFCGRYPLATIRATWAKRAAEIARRSQPSRRRLLKAAS